MPPRCVSGKLYVRVKVLARTVLGGQALGTGPVGVDHAADRRQVPGLESGDG